MLALAVFILIYVSFGGLKAVVYTDCFQTLLIIDGVACTTGAISHIAESSAGKQYTTEPSGLNEVNEGSVIEAITDGGSTNTSKMELTFVIRR